MSVDEATREGMRERASGVMGPHGMGVATGANFASRSVRAAAIDLPDDARLVALEERQAGITRALLDVTKRLDALEAAPPMTGWRAYFYKTVLSSRFQLAVVSVLGVIANALSGEALPNEAMLSILGLVIAYIGGRSYTDGKLVQADAEKTKAAANVAIMAPRG